MTAKNQRKEEVMSILEDHCNVLKNNFLVLFLRFTTGQKQEMLLIKHS